MRIVCFDSEKVLTDTRKKITGGQRSGICKCIYQEVSGDKWGIKDSRVLEEYLGFSAFRALGINVADFNIGYIHQDEMDSPETLVFLHKYLEGSQEHPLRVNNSDLSSLPLKQVLPLILSAAIVGDVDATGKNNDNFLLESSLEGDIERIFKIDCGRAFEALDYETLNWALAESPFLGQFNKLIQTSKETSDFASIGNKFLTSINIDQVCQALTSSFENFQILQTSMLKLKFHQKNFSRLSCNFPSREGVSVYFHPENKHLFSITQINQLIRDRFNSIKNHFDKINQKFATSALIEQSFLTKSGKKEEEMEATNQTLPTYSSCAL